VLALGAGIGTKIFALAALAPALGAAALVATHAGGRLAAVAVIAILPYAGGISAAKIKPLGYGITRADLVIATIFGILPLLLLPWVLGLSAFAAAGAASTLTALYGRHLLGGYTGDVLGAVEQSYEIVFLLAAAACV
jgi:adenosylcobinamide-GDP ribazoletransferase